MPLYIFYLDKMIYFYNFSSKCNLKVHMERLKRFKCEKCSQKFTERKALTLHIKGIHEKIKEFNCDRCDKFFSKEYNLKDHVQTVHEKERNFICQIWKRIWYIKNLTKTFCQST